MKPEDWCNMTDALFKATGGGLGTAKKGVFCTNHSIRRSAAQWAGRCKAGEMDVRNNGRWKSMEVLAVYLGQGCAMGVLATEANDDDDDDTVHYDPLEKVWWYQPVTVAGFNGLDCM
jgi:hypothetical protein